MTDLPPLLVIDTPILPDQWLPLLEDPACGGLVTFEGRVRNHQDGRGVDGLDYQAYVPMADRVLRQILDEVRDRTGARRVIAVHRHGSLAVGDIAVWVGAAAEHRHEAFVAAREVIDAIKHRLPIWKQEHYLDGSREWVRCHHTHAEDDHPA